MKLFKKIAVFTVSVLVLSGCEQSPEPKEELIQIDLLSGCVQKGPYLIGSSLSVYELDHDLSQTGRSFSTEISNNLGEFSLSNLSLSSPYLEINASGFYYDEVKGKNSSAQLSLSALVDVENRSDINVNILTHLEKDRISYLVGEGMSFEEAKRTAQEEVLSVFLIDKEEMTPSEGLNIARDGEDNAILLAVSVIVQGHLDVAGMSELLGKMKADLKTDGTLDDQELGNALLSNAKLAKLPEIREYLEGVYEGLGVASTIPDFETAVGYFVENSGYEFDYFPLYPESTVNGSNILYLDRDTFSVDEPLSLAAELIPGTSLQVKLQGGLWWMAVSKIRNWNHTIYDYVTRSQVFTATSPGELSDQSLEFEVEDASQVINIYYYENGATEPTRTRQIVILNEETGEGDPPTYPESGAYGANLLAMEPDTLLLDSEDSYSLSVLFPQWDEASVSFKIGALPGPETFTTDVSDTVYWNVYSDGLWTVFTATGKDALAELPVVFHGTGDCMFQSSEWDKWLFWE